jgi:hypothetical protein
MATEYKVNGRIVSESEYKAFVAANPMPTLPPMTAAAQAATLAKYENSNVAFSGLSEQAQQYVATPLPPIGVREVPGVPNGAIPLLPPQVQTTFADVNGNVTAKDQRVKIRVPGDYLTDLTVGPNDELLNLGGIVFPYTPSISYELKAEYAAQSPLHSNFALNFYQRSSVGSISISGKFSVENEADAGVYLSTVHLLKALTRMRSSGENNTGSPPPVCRLDAYGDMMLENVPVAIASFRIELPDSVDYFSMNSERYGSTSVPTMSTIAITCMPMYSRQEMQNFTVTGYLNDTSFRGKGFI